jgi:hypothetical protein
MRMLNLVPLYILPEPLILHALSRALLYEDCPIAEYRRMNKLATRIEVYGGTCRNKRGSADPA